MVKLLLEANEASASETDCFDDTALHMNIQSYSNDDHSFGYELNDGLDVE